LAAGTGLEQAATDGFDHVGFRDRWAGWDRTPFTSDSQSQVAVFETES